MAYGLGVRVTDPQGKPVDKVFRRFPVRIGRNVLNDLQVDSLWVSQFHAVIELHQGKLMLRDLGSTNGTHLVDGRRVSPNELTDLSTAGFQFKIVSIVFQTYTANLASNAPEPAKRKPLAATGYLQAPPAELIAALARRTAPTDLAEYQPLYSSYRAAFSQLLMKLQESATGLDQANREALLRDAAHRFPALPHETEFQRLAASLGVSIAPAGGNMPAGAPPAVSAGGNESIIALQGLREVASEYLPGMGAPETGDEIIQFLNRLRDTLDVFFKCFVPLRDGHKQFEAEMAINMDRRNDGSAGAFAVQSAKEPKELSSCLLGFRTSNAEAVAAVESVFADVMIQQVAMLSGVMNGVRSLLNELSPAEVEQLAEKSRSGLGVGPYRFKSLWNFYKQRYEDLADEENQVFSLLFGPQFAQAYEQHVGRRSKP